MSRLRPVSDRNHLGLSDWATDFWHDGCMGEAQLIWQQINEAQTDLRSRMISTFITSLGRADADGERTRARRTQHRQPSNPDGNLTLKNDYRAIMTPHTARAADDFETIRQRMIALRLQRDGKCAIREGSSSVNCWCYKVGPAGNTLPCPPPVDDGPNA